MVLIGDSSSGLLNPAGRGQWRLGWGVNDVRGVPVFRLKAFGKHLDLLIASGF